MRGQLYSRLFIVIDETYSFVLRPMHCDYCDSVHCFVISWCGVVGSSGRPLCVSIVSLRLTPVPDSMALPCRFGKDIFLRNLSSNYGDTDPLLKRPF